MFGHGVVHKGVIFVAHKSSGIGDLRDIAAAITLIRTAPVPDLVLLGACVVIWSFHLYGEGGRHYSQEALLRRAVYLLPEGITPGNS